MPLRKGARVLLVRHAESVDNTSPEYIGGRGNETPITALGRLQSFTLGRYFAKQGIKPDVVKCSPARRTIETGSICLSAMLIKPEFIIDDRLQELDTGDWTGRLRSEVYTPEVLEHINAEGIDSHAPGGETMRQVGNRMYDALPEDSTADQLHLVFTHGLATRSLVGMLLGWHNQQIYRAVTGNTSVTGLSYDDGWQLDFMNLDPSTQAAWPL